MHALCGILQQTTDFNNKNVDYKEMMSGLCVLSVSNVPPH